MVVYCPEEYGHRRIHCQRCGFQGWSEDTGACPRCDPEDRMIPWCERQEFMSKYRWMRKQAKNDDTVPGVPCPMAGVQAAYRDEHDPEA